MRPQRPQRPARAQHPARGRRKLFRRLYWLTFAMYCPDDDDGQERLPGKVQPRLGNKRQEIVRR